MTEKQYLALLAAIITIIGWFISNYLSKKREEHKSQLMWEKELIHSQLENLYGPIYAILMECKFERESIRDMFGRSTLFKYGSLLTEEENKVYCRYMSEVFIPSNQKIINIIKNNIQYLHGYEIPSSFLDFISYAKAVETIYKKISEGEGKFGNHGYENYHASFQKEIIHMVSSLKKAQWLIIKQSLPSPYFEETK